MLNTHRKMITIARRDRSVPYRDPCTVMKNFHGDCALSPPGDFCTLNHASSTKASIFILPKTGVEQKLRRHTYHLHHTTTLVTVHAVPHGKSTLTGRRLEGGLVIYGHFVYLQRRSLPRRLLVKSGNDNQPEIDGYSKKKKKNEIRCS